MSKANIVDLFPMHTFHILDAEAHRQWEDLLGTPIQSNTIKLTPKTYRTLAEEIQVIQLAAALRTGKIG